MAIYAQVFGHGRLGLLGLQESIDPITFLLDRLRAESHEYFFDWLIERDGVEALQLALKTNSQSCTYKLNSRENIDEAM